MAASLLAMTQVACLQVCAQVKPVVVLDPGHSGKDVKNIDTETKLVDHDYPNHPEMEEMFRVSRMVGSKLQAEGFKVIYTKGTADKSVSLRERATIAKNAHAALGVSIHDDHGKPYKNFAQVYAQKAGLWRGGTQKRPKAVFTNKTIALLSLEYAKIFAKERTKAERHTVAVTPISFDNRPGIEPGNIPQVMLFAGSEPNAVPWIYNEVGGKNFGRKQEALYAQGIFLAIKKCLERSAKKENSEQPIARKTVQ